MTTALAENSPSMTVTVTPLPAEIGDANGSGAPDMNADQDINILDVVGIAHTILGSTAETAKDHDLPDVSYSSLR